MEVTEEGQVTPSTPLPSFTQLELTPQKSHLAGKMKFRAKAFLSQRHPLTWRNNLSAKNNCGQGLVLDGARRHAEAHSAVT